MKSYKSYEMVVTVEGTSIKKIIMLGILGLMMLFSLIGVLTSLKPEYRLSSSSINTMATQLSGESLVYLLGYENRYFTQSLPETSQPPKYSSLIFEMATSINPDDPRSLLGGELPGFSIFDSKIIIAGEGTNYTNMPFESAPPLEVLMAEREAAIQNLEQVNEQKDDNNSISPPAKTTGDKKVVYIYHTHSRESYLPHLKGVTDPNKAFHSKVNITLVGERLGKELEERGIGSVVDKMDFTGLLLKKGWNYTNDSYDVSRPVVQDVIAKNRDLTFFFDIHRDSSRRDITTVTINGKDYARTVFIIGRNNEKYEKNRQLAADLHHLLQKKYPGLSRGVLEKSKGNARYNQDLSENAILIEFGGVDNTFEELNRTAEAVADVFAEYYWQAEKVDAPTSSEEK
jgi:stage II sporulation protein P